MVGIFTTIIFMIDRNSCIVIIRTNHYSHKFGREIKEKRILELLRLNLGRKTCVTN